MRQDPLTALSLHADDASLTLAAPKLGRFTAKVAEGQWVTPGMVLGSLAILHQRLTVIAPPDAAGVITYLAASHREHPVEYRAPLLTLQPADATPGAAPRSASRADDALLSDLAPGAEVLRAAMDGQFYRRAAPDAPPFIEAGQVVQPGDTLGLIEVMKFFYPLRSEAAGPRLIERVLVADSVAVHAGHPLLVWRPAP